MPLPGGPADKLGNRYELLWTAKCMADILADLAKHIRLEPPGEEGIGIEFVLTRNQRKEFHQVKRQQAEKGRWTISNLASVLQNFRQHLEREPEAFCEFVSSEASPGLKELTDRAQRSTSLQEFKSSFLGAESVLKSFTDLCHLWTSCDEGTVWSLLRRIKTTTIDDNQLEDSVVSRLAPLITLEPKTAAQILMSHALEMVHHDLDAHALWSHLEEHNCRPTDWGRDQSVAASVREAAERYCSAEVSHISRIEREEATHVMAAFTDTSSAAQIVFLTGDAGTGKSGVVVQVIEKARDLGWPVIAFRLDRIEPVTHPAELKDSLGLPGSPAAVLAAVSHGSDCLLVIDQLDAVSTVSGRHPQFFHCFEQLIREAKAHSRLRVLVACRRFDLDHDHRLRSLKAFYQTAPIISVARLSEEMVRHAATELGLEGANLSLDQVSLLSLPLHLVLLAGARDGAPDSTLGFGTALDLYDAFWEAKRQSCQLRRDAPIRFAEACSQLCDLMSRTQALSVNRDQLLDLENEIDAMVSEHVLRRDGRRISFFHEGFFDYVFARVFIGSDRQLSDLVLDGEQHLFRRAQVRQLLLYRRAAEGHAAFIADLRWLFSDDRVRFHLRQIGFLVLAGLPDPNEEEWRLVRQLMESPDCRLSNWSQRALEGSAGWLRLLDDLGVLSEWLCDDSPRINDALRILARSADEEPDRVADLLAPLVDREDTWRRRISSVIDFRANVIRSDAGWRLIRRMIALSDVAPSDYRLWSKSDPSRCYEALAIRLDRLARTTPLSLGRYSGGQEVPYGEVAAAAPSAFIRHLRDPIVNLISRVPSTIPDRPQHDDLSWYRGGVSSESGQLFDAMSGALSRLGQQDIARFREHVAVMARTDWLTIHLVIGKAMAKAGCLIATDAASYLRELFDRYDVGESEYLLWSTRDVIESLAVHWSDEEYRAIERRILEVSSRFERTRRGYMLRGRSQRLLLDALPDVLLSSEARRRRGEWRRSPRTKAGDRPWRTRGGMVQSPIPKDAVARMSDHQWLQAIERYHGNEDIGWSEGRPRGGARQLWIDLYGRTKEEPERFSQLCLKFPAGTNPLYFNAVLQGIHETEVDLNLDLLQQDVLRCHDVPECPCGRWIARVIGKNAHKDLSCEIIDVLRWYGLNDPDPISDLSREETPGGSSNYGGDILAHGINSVRGAVAEAIAEIIRFHSDQIDSLRDVTESLICNHIIAVRACAAKICIAVFVHDPADAVSLFQRLVADNECLLATHHVSRFLHYAVRDHFQLLQPTIERMLASSESKLVKAGSRLVCLAAFDVTECEGMAETMLDGEPPRRQGAAEIYSANLLLMDCREKCEAALRRLFYDSEEAVRSDATDFVRGLSTRELAEFIPLLDDLVASPAFNESHEMLFYKLQKATVPEPDFTLSVIQRFLDLKGHEAGDISKSAAHMAKIAGDLLVRCYSQSENQELRGRCLDLIDLLMGREAFGLEKTLESMGRS